MVLVVMEFLDFLHYLRLKYPQYVGGWICHFVEMESHKGKFCCVGPVRKS